MTTCSKTAACAIPTGKFRILWDNKFDIAALDASSEWSKFPVENIQHDWFLKHWRSAIGGIDEYICIDLSDSGIIDRDIRAWVIKSHNLDFATGDAYAIQGSDTDICGSILTPESGELDEPFTPTDDIIVGFFDDCPAPAQNFLFWKIVLDSSGSKGAGDYQWIGRIFLGDYFQPRYRPTAYPETTDIDPSTILMSMAGQKQANVITQYQRIRYRWGALPAYDVADLKAIFAAVGKHTPYFICWDSDAAATTTYYVRNVSDWTYTPIGNGCYAVEIEVETER